MQLRMAVAANPARGLGGNRTRWSGRPAFVAPRPGLARPAPSTSPQELWEAPSMTGASESRGAAPTRGSRILTGSAIALMGGLLWQASQGHVWARDLVATAGPLFILLAGILAVIVVTDRDDIAGKTGIVAGVALLFMARVGIIPEATLLALAPWALVAVGTVIALSGLGLRAHPAAERTATRTEAGPGGTTRACERPLHRPFVNGTSGRQQAQAS